MLLFGQKTLALFDIWSIEHLLSGMSFGGLVVLLNSKFNQTKCDNKLSKTAILRLDIITLLFLAFLWETIEIYLELGAAGPAVKYWFYGVEHPSNRLISDPALMLLGYYIVRKTPQLIIPARYMSLIWLSVHIFIFPHSMYLHEIF